MMSRSARLLRVVVASPSDVQRERETVEEVTSELNETTAYDRNLRLEVGRWEADDYPGFHVDGRQGICDQVLKIKAWDILVGIFWSRFGTLTRTRMTGTEHEISEAIARWRKMGTPQVMIFFNSAGPRLKSAAERHQWALVAEFQERFPEEGMFWEYDGDPQFETEFRRCLKNYLRVKFPVAKAATDQEFRLRQSVSSKKGIRLSIDPRVPAESLPGIFTSFSELVKQYAALGLDLRAMSGGGAEGDDVA